MHKLEQSFLEEKATCWRRAKARRAAVLIDGATYYGALREACRKAHSTIFIVGWDIDSRTRLVGPSGEADDGLPDRLGPFLTELVAHRPDLRVYILLWDYSMLYALEREPLPAVNLAWKMPDHISICLDDVLPVGASHHQKIVVIDDRIAFCGGLDLTVRRWDTSAHAVENGSRTDPAGKPYRPFHDIQMLVDGAAAQSLADFVRNRWCDAACESPTIKEVDNDPWPDSVEADFTDTDIGIARTLPAYDGRGEIREVERLYERSIELAERFIYIEAQYLTANAVAVSLAQRLRENPDLEVLIVGPNVHQSWLEERSMNTGRRRFMQTIEKAGAGKRVRLLYPAIPDDDTGEGVMVHSKFMIVDDRFLRVGSANLNNRSMGMDTECDLALEGRSSTERQRIRHIRNRLLAEHLGVDVADVEAALTDRGSFLHAVNDLSRGARCLRPIDLADTPDDDLAATVGELADPEKPIATPTFVGDLFGGSATSESPKRLLKLSILAAGVLSLVALWRLTPLSDLMSPDFLHQWLQATRQELWLPVIIPFIFVLGGLVAFPVTILIAVMGMMFTPLLAFVFSLSGSLLSAVVVFLIGTRVGRSPLRSFAGPKVNRITRVLVQQGILSMTALRMVPVAPFTLVNLVAGASQVRLVDFMLGTVLGMAPGVLIMSVLGHQLWQTLKNPTLIELFLFALAMIGWLCCSIGLQVMAVRLRSKRNG